MISKDENPESFTTHVAFAITLISSAIAVSACIIGGILISSKVDYANLELEIDRVEFSEAPAFYQLRRDRDPYERRNSNRRNLNPRASKPQSAASKKECKCSSTPRCPAGPPGNPGNPGEPGQPGTSGEAGFEGFAGSLPPAPYSWDKSNRPCIQCPAGATGANGRLGVPGAQGPKGESGDDGTDGKKGQKGVGGLPGGPGDVGIPGEPGDQGRPGRSGTVGGKGQGGEEGAPGIVGAHGAPGRPGTDGYDGIPGDRGLGGPQGQTGREGIPGVSGTAGPQGTAGMDAGYCELCNGQGSDNNGYKVDLRQFGGELYNRRRFSRRKDDGNWVLLKDAPIATDENGRPVLVLAQLQLFQETNNSTSEIEGVEIDAKNWTGAKNESETEKIDVPGAVIVGGRAISEKEAKKLKKKGYKDAKRPWLLEWTLNNTQ